jgi:hypothetical protein
MPLFEVFIPAPQADGFNVTAKVRGDSWMQALRNGLTRLGVAADVRNLLVDINEDGIDVTEPTSGRVFRIRELDEASLPADAAEPALPVSLGTPNDDDDDLEVEVLEADAPAPDVEAAPAVAAAVAPSRAMLEAAANGAVRPTGAVPPPTPAATPAAPRLAPPSADAGATPSAVRVAAPAQVVGTLPPRPRFGGQGQEVGVVRQRPAAGLPTPSIGRRVEIPERSSDDLISELFQLTQEIYDKPDLEAAANFILDLAMRSVSVDAGAVFISDINQMDLYFAAARGPKASEAMRFRVPMGQGIVGFCAQEGVALAVSEAQRDPRFYAAVSKGVGYETRSILCAPAQIQGQVFGAIELINKRQGSTFTAVEMSVLNFLAHELADYLTHTGLVGE